MANKTITVMKDGVTKEVSASLEKNYVANGWVVIKTPVNPYTNLPYDSIKK